VLHEYNYKNFEMEERVLFTPSVRSCAGWPQIALVEVYAYGASAPAFQYPFSMSK